MGDYFQESVNMGQPIVPPTPPPPPPVVPKPPVETVKVGEAQAPSTPVQEETKKYPGLPVRGDGDRIFMLLKGKKWWVTTPEVYAKLGFKFGDEVHLDEETLNVLPEGEPIR